MTFVRKELSLWLRVNIPDSSETLKGNNYIFCRIDGNARMKGVKKVEHFETMKTSRILQ